MRTAKHEGITPVTGFGTVCGVPHLSTEFVKTFNSVHIALPQLNLHAVIGGNGPPLLLLGGWPQTWFSWRFIMPVLAKYYTVIVIESRGVGRSDKPADGYDSATVAADIVMAMNVLGYEQFALVGHDIGMWTAYAIAHDFPARVTRLAMIDATIPGISPSAPLLGTRQISDFLWHFNFNRARDINEQLVQGREDIYFGYQFATKAGRPDAIPPYALQHYVETLQEPNALRASFEYYRSLDLTMEQNAVRRKTKLVIPVLAVGGAKAVGAKVGAEMSSVADIVTAVVIPDRGHFVQEEAPQALIAALLPFLQPYLEDAEAVNSQCN